MRDMRVTPVAASIWITLLICLRISIHLKDAVVVTGVLVALAATLAAWRVRDWHNERGRPRPRRMRTPVGSLRLGWAAILIASGAAAIVAGSACDAHARDPTVRLIDSGRTYVTLRVRLIDDPAAMASRWNRTRFYADARVEQVEVSHGQWQPSNVNVMLMGAGIGEYVRDDRVLVRGSIDSQFRSDPPFVGAMEAENIELTERPGGWVSIVRHVRSSMRQVCSTLTVQGQALVPGVAIGDDRAMNEELSDAMKTSSLTHLTAVSGTHIAIMLSLIVSAVPGRGLIRAGATLAAMSLLVAVVGPQPSVIRAVLTASVGVAGLLLKRPGGAQAALSTVVVLVLLIDPFSARAVGFALSVLATWGVVGPAQQWNEAVKHAVRSDAWYARCIRRLLQACCVPLAAQILVAPVLVLMSPLLPVWGVIANVLVSPVIAPACVCALMAAVCAPWWPAAATLMAHVAQIFTGWIAWVATWVSSWPMANVSWPQGIEGTIVLASAAIGMLSVSTVVRRCRRRMSH